jgi:excisionase family DNA binding protein
MSQDLISVEEVAQMLGLHVKTVRHYVREGRIKAVRIGKQYRIARKDLEALTGSLAVVRHRHIEASTIVAIDAVSKDTANRAATLLTASAQGRPPGGTPLRIDTIYDEERARLKVIISGGITETIHLLSGLDTVLKD